MTATTWIARAAVRAAIWLPLAATAAPATTVFQFYSFPQKNTGQPVLPAGALVAVGNALYGVSADGGASPSPGLGTIFAVTQTGLTEVYSFKGGSVDASDPFAGLLDLAGVLYGTSFGGGSAAVGVGTVFAFNPATGAERLVHAFNATNQDGYYPQGAALIAVGGQLYGTTEKGGAYGNGVVFRINPSIGAEVILHSFASTGDGATPHGALLDVGGILYGTTAAGGTSGNGTVFKIDPTTGAESLLYSFAGGADGQSPYAGLIDVGGILYGTTAFAGVSPENTYGGTVFKIDPATGIETVLHELGALGDASYPVADLLDVSGTLYGTSYFGGSAIAHGSLADGTVFKIDAVTGAETIVHSFRGSDGAGPGGALIEVGALLYGTAEGGGQYKTGTVFRLSP